MNTMRRKKTMAKTLARKKASTKDKHFIVCNNTQCKNHKTTQQFTEQFKFYEMDKDHTVNFSRGDCPLCGNPSKTFRLVKKEG
jgi:acid phosphatase class B